MDGQAAVYLIFYTVYYMRKQADELISGHLVCTILQHQLFLHDVIEDNICMRELNGNSMSINPRTRSLFVPCSHVCARQPCLCHAAKWRNSDDSVLCRVQDVRRGTIFRISVFGRTKERIQGDGKNVHFSFFSRFVIVTRPTRSHQEVITRPTRGQQEVTMGLQEKGVEAFHAKQSCLHKTNPTRAVCPTTYRLDLPNI